MENARHLVESNQQFEKNDTHAQQCGQSPPLQLATRRSLCLHLSPISPHCQNSDFPKQRNHSGIGNREAVGKTVLSSFSSSSTCQEERIVVSKRQSVVQWRVSRKIQTQHIVVRSLGLVARTGPTGSSSDRTHLLFLPTSKMVRLLPGAPVAISGWQQPSDHTPRNSIIVLSSSISRMPNLIRKSTPPCR